MNPTEHRTFPPRNAALGDVIAYVERFCRERDVPASDRLRLVLVVEELFTNTVTHGHAGGTDGAVHLTLADEAGAVTLCYEDTAPPFDPFATPARDPAAGPESRAVGGVGLLLVRRLARDLRYAYEDGRNRLWLRMARGAGESRGAAP